MIVWTAMCTGLLACDTESNTENPDQHYFVRYYGGNGNQYGVDMVAMSDGSFVLLGTDAEREFASNVYLLRVDAEGNVLWETTYGEGEVWTPKDIEPTIDGNLIIAADYKSGVGANNQITLLKFSPDGNFIAKGTYGTPGNENTRSVTPLSDGGFIISGTTDSTQTWNLPGETELDPGDVFNLRVDANLIPYPKNDWGPAYHGFAGDNMDVSVKIFERPGGQFYVFGFTNSSLGGDLNPDEKFGLFYFSRNESGGVSTPWYPGNFIPEHDTEINYVQLISQNLGGGYLVIGTSQSSTGISEIFLARLRQSLTFSGPRTNEASFYETIPLGRNRNIRGVSGALSVSGEVGFLILGNEVRSTTGATNFWLSKVDQTGQELWSTTFGSEAEDDTGAAVLELSDGKIAILGTMGLADNQSKMAFIKVNRDGKLLK